MSAALLPVEIATQFRLPRAGPYLASHSAGAQPRAAIAALHRHFLDPWGDTGGAWNAWLAAIDDWRNGLGGLLGVAAQDLCPTPGVGAGLSRYMSALDTATERRTILLAPSAFPTIGYVVSGLAARGWRVRYLPPDADVRVADSWAAALDEDVALVIAMHVSSNSGALADLGAIATAAHAAGARCIADCAQSAGVVPVAPALWGVDAAIGSCLKWLCGGPGAGWLWVAPHDRTLLEPAERGWWSHADPFAMDIHDFRYAPDARRWWGGTPDVAPFVLAAAGIAAITAIGIDAIRVHNLCLQTALRDQLQHLIPQWRWPDSPIGGTICIDVGTDQPRIAAIIAAESLHADLRGSTLRLSFHAYNGIADVEAAARILRG
jgi:kynureninase